MLFHDGLQLLARDLDRKQRIVIFVNLNAVSVEEWTLFQVGILCKQGSQGHVRVGLLHLHQVDQVGNGVVLNDGVGNAGQQVHRVHKGSTDFTHDLGRKGQALLMEILHLRQERGVRRDCGGVQQLRCGLVIFNNPLAVFLLQGEGHLAHKFAVVGRFQHGNTGNLLVHLGMCVTNQQAVQLVGVLFSNFLCAFHAVFAFQTVVNRTNHHIRLALQLCQNLSGFLHGRGEGHLIIAGGVGRLPLGNMGRVDAKDRHFDAVYIKNRVGILPASAVGLVDIASQRLSLECRNGLLQAGKFKVKLMVAQNPGIVANGIHGLDHGVDIFIAEFLDVVGLQAVACIDQQQVRVLGPLLCDNRRHMGHTGCTFRIGGIVKGIDHAMEIAGLQNGNGFLACIGCVAGNCQAQRQHQCQDHRWYAPA